MKKLACVLALSGAFVSTNVLGWGNEGHRVVGAIAGKLLKDSRAQQRIDALLLPGETLESITLWADCVKGTFCGEQTPEMQAYVAANARHNEYHYTDIPFQHAHYQHGAVGSAENDIVQTLKQAIAVLQGKSNAASNPHGFTPRQALLLIAHLVGDIHQPLHVGAAYVGADGKFIAPEKHEQIDAVNIFDARGGNNLLLDDAKIRSASAALIPAREDGADSPSRSPTKPFHAYWDSTVVEYAMRRVSARTPAQFAQSMIDAKPTVGVNHGDVSTWPVQWANDTLAVSKLAYADVAPGLATQQTNKKGETYRTWSLGVPDNYPVPSSALAKTQLVAGGYHLAALLAAIWP